MLFQIDSGRYLAQQTKIYIPFIAEGLRLARNVHWIRSLPFIADSDVHWDSFSTSEKSVPYGCGRLRWGGGGVSYSWRVATV
jgi:hypothetical protein